jgi:pyridoxal/pyridoxine/pyridoxamine kinase
MGEQLKILSVSSFATHGNASLKLMLQLLGNKVLPVPSLYLTGLSNIPNIQKHSLPFEDILMGTFDICRAREQRIILHIGYLSNPEQAETVLKELIRNQDLIEEISIDPVLGDEGRFYVPQEMADEWMKLMPYCDYLMPNVFEHDELTRRGLYDALPENARLLITSFSKEKAFGVNFIDHGKETFFEHPQIQKRYGGSGDAFAAFLLNNLFFNNYPMQYSVQKATFQVYELVKTAYDHQWDELDGIAAYFNQNS